MNSHRNRTDWAGLMRRAALLGGVSALAIGAFAAPSLAQDGSGVETVVVTGLRGSLQKNLDIKRESLGLVDAISSEDIGKFPDTNLAAAMQRIPGVSISRASTSMGASQPTTTGDATEITVRGFGPNFNETLYDGRKISTATGTRAFDFSSVSSDFVQEINILKSPDATLSGGAIGATVNIKFPKPMDNPGMRLVVSASSTFSPEDGRPTPNGSVLFSDTFAGDRFGVLADISYQDTRTLANHDSTQGWEGTHFDPCQLAGGPACPAKLVPDATKNVWYIQDYGIYQEHNNEQRINGRLVLQWRPTDSVLITLNDNYSRDSLHQDQYGYSIWFNAGSLRNVQLAPDGSVVNFIQPNTPTDFQAQFNGQVLQNNEVGFNVKWNLNDNFSVVLDGDTAQSSLNPGGQLSSIDVDVGYGPSCSPDSATGTPCVPTPTNGTNVGVVIGPGHSLPYPSGIGPTGNAAMFINNNLMGSHVLPMTSNQNRDTVNQIKLEGDWTNDKLQIKAGFQYMANHANLRSYNDFTNNDWQAYSGYGSLSNNYYQSYQTQNPADPYIGLPAGVALDQSWFKNSFGTGNFISGWSGANNLPARILQFNPFQVLNYLQSLGNPQTKVIPGYNGIGSGCCNPGFDGVYRMVLVPGSFQRLFEDTYAGYVSVSAETELGGMPLKVNVGVREELTDFSTTGLGQLPTALTVQAADHTAFNVTFGSTSEITKSNSYQYLLPNLDLALSITDDLQVRFDASRTMTRPPFTIAGNSVLSPTLSFPAGERVGSLVASGGNPNLLPFTSDNVDLSAEWYYGPNSYISINGFLKTVSNFIVAGATQQTVNGVIDPTTGLPGQWTISTNVNGPTANVYGGEFAVQHVFGDTGFGVQANATVVGTNKPYDPLNTSISGFAVTGLADSANIVAFYDKDGFMFRVAANWRDSYLDSFGQRQNNSLFGAEPTFVNPSTQIDLSTSYDITPQVNVYFEALNLNNATYSTHGRFSEQLLDVVDYGRRFTLGVHFKL